uniref:Ig-like domain-containing protein n=1 Tax=Arion vulgaris TaxID=1028688 RepID=A0A0B7AYH0_9EUPU
MWTTPAGNTFYQHHFHPDASQHLLTPEDIQPDSKFHDGHYWHHTSSYRSELSSYSDRILILSDGSLYIDYLLRTDAGPYICQVSNVQYNQTVTVKLYVECHLSGHVKIFGLITGLICALSFFTLNVIYVIISWIARRLVNKRRREIIRQMLENLNAYKSTQIGRIHENYTHQISRVRNQYHIQGARLHRNYTSQVTKVKRGCSNQVERVRDNYNNKLAQLRDYSSNQIMQIRERANGQIIRIRDYGAVQLEKLRETYKFQQQHVLKLLDTMNLENCRNIVETECMKAESMMYDIDLLGDDDRTDSPSSPGDSEYSTAVSSPSSSPEDLDSAGLRRDMSYKRRELSTDSSENSGMIVEMQTTIDLEAGLPADFSDTWKYGEDCHYEDDSSNEYLMSLGEPSLLQLRNDPTFIDVTVHHQTIKPGVPLPMLDLNRGHFSVDISEEESSKVGHVRSDSDGTYVTPEASPTKVWSGVNSLSAFVENSRTEWPNGHEEDCDINFSNDNEALSPETIL